jgi:hypothetical protein
MRRINFVFWIELNMTLKILYFAFYHSTVVGILHFGFYGD